MLCNDKKWKMETNVYHLETTRVIKPPRAGARWKGVHHYKLTMAALDYISEELGLNYFNSRYWLSADEQDMAFSVNVRLPEHQAIEVQDADNGTGTALYPSFGFIASNSRRYQLTFYCGVASMDTPEKACAEKWLGEKYTMKFNPIKQMQAAVDEFILRYPRVEKVLRKTKKIILSESRMTKIVMEAGRRNISIPWGRIGGVIKSMEDMRVTAWRTAMEFGRMVERNPPFRQMDQLYDFMCVCREFYPEHLGLAEDIETAIVE